MVQRSRCCNGGIVNRTHLEREDSTFLKTQSDSTPNSDREIAQKTHCMWLCFLSTAGAPRILFVFPVAVSRWWWKPDSWDRLYRSDPSVWCSFMNLSRLYAGSWAHHRAVTTERHYNPGSDWRDGILSSLESKRDKDKHDLKFKECRWMSTQLLLFFPNWLCLTFHCVCSKTLQIKH